MHEALARLNFDKDVGALGDLAAERFGLTVHSRVYPILDATIQHTTPLRLRLQADSWDEQPPSIHLLNPDGSAWTGTLPGGVFNPGPHSNGQRNFICMRGSHEYHTHGGHLNDCWEQYRGKDGMNLIGILVQLAVAWRKALP